MAMQPPTAAERKKLEGLGYSKEEIDQEFGMSSPAAAPPAPVKKPTTLMEDVVGMTRAGMNKATFQQYPKMAGGVAHYLGGADAQEEARKLGEYMAEYKSRSPGKAKVAETIGEVVPYLAAGPEMLLTKAAALPGMAKAAGMYGAARKAAGAIGKTVLPASAKTAAQVGLTEGARAASEAEEGTSPLAAALKAATIAQPFGRVGEVFGTYVSGKMGKSIDELSAEAEAKAQEAGQIMNQWREKAQVQVTPALAKLYAKSKDLRETIDAMSQSLGLPATHPDVLSEAYSKLTAAASPVFKKRILRPFLEAIDDASAATVKTQGIRPLSEGIRKYAESKGITEAIEQGAKTGAYLLRGAGDPTVAGPAMLTQRMTRSFVPEASRTAASRAAIASIKEQSPAIPLTLTKAGTEMARTLLTGGPRGVGEIADLAARLGGGSFGQRMAQAAGRGIGASQRPTR